MSSGSFDGLAFEVTTSPLDEDTALVYSERIIPGGTNTYIDIAGVSLPKLKMTLYFPNPADYVTMHGKVGVTNSLVYVAGTVNALCVDVHRTKRNLGATGETWADASFIVTP